MVFVVSQQPLRSGFADRLDALCAKHLVHWATLLHDDGLLQVRFERAVGRPLGEGAVVSEGCGFATVCAFCHEIIFLSCYNSK